MIKTNDLKEVLESLPEGKLRDLNEQEYASIDKISEQMKEVKRNYLLMEHEAYINSSERPFTC